MKIRCRQCGEYFLIDKQTAKLIEGGYVSPQEVDTCDDCNQSPSFNELRNDDDTEL